MVLLARQVVVGLLADDRGLREATSPWSRGRWRRLLAAGRGRARAAAGAGAAADDAHAGRPVSRRACSSLGGVFLDRYLFVTAGQIVPATAHAGAVSSPYASYMPSPVELAIIAGAVAFVALGYTLAERYLDLRQEPDHMNWAWPWLPRPRGPRRGGGRGMNRPPSPATGSRPSVIALVGRSHLAAFLLVVAVPDLSSRRRHLGADRDAGAPAATPTPLSPMANSPVGDPDGGQCGLLRLPRHHQRHRGHEEHPGDGPPAVGLAKLHRLPHDRQPRVHGAWPLRSPQGRLPGVPQGPGRRLGSEQPAAPARAHGLHRAMHVVPRPGPARPAARFDEGPGDNCWICHNGPEFTYLFNEDGSPSPVPPSPAAAGAG